MPFNRVTNIKQTVMWLLVLNNQNEIRTSSEAAAKKIDISKVGNYIPGLMLIPIPEAGFWFGYIDWAFWAVFGYVLGSIAYVVDSFYLWGLTYYYYSDDAANPQNYWNTIAVVLFVLNALTCILDWWLQEKHLSLCNMFVDPISTGGLKVEEIPIKQATYYFWNNFFFLGAAVIFLIQCMWMENIKTDLLGCSDSFCGSFWINFWGNTLYLFSSYFAILEFFANLKERKDLNLPPLYLFTLKFRDIDWFGWGDWLYFVISVASVFQSFLQTYIRGDDDLIAPYYLSVNVLFLLDSIAYMIGYMLFVYDLRAGLLTGLVSENNTGALTALLGDTVNAMDFTSGEGDEEDGPTGRPTGTEMTSAPGHDGGGGGGSGYSHASPIGRESTKPKQSFSARPGGGSLFGAVLDENGQPMHPQHHATNNNVTDNNNHNANAHSGFIALKDIRSRLAEAQSIRQRRTIDFVERPAPIANLNASATIFTPILDPSTTIPRQSSGVSTSSSFNTMASGDMELLGGVAAAAGGPGAGSESSSRARSVSMDHIDRLKTSTPGTGGGSTATIVNPLIAPQR